MRPHTPIPHRACKCVIVYRGARFAGDEINSKACAFSVAHDRPEMRSQISFNFLLPYKGNDAPPISSMAEFYVFIVRQIHLDPRKSILLKYLFAEINNMFSV